MDVFKNGEPNYEADVPLLRIFKDEEERSFLDQEQPESPQIKEEEEEELCSSQEEEQLLLKQEIKSESDELHVIQFEDPSEKHVYKEETDDEQELLWKQERSSSLNEGEQELPQIKEEWEEVCIIEEEEQLELKQETDTFMVTEYEQEKMDSEPEPEENTQIRNSDAATVQLNPPSTVPFRGHHSKSASAI
ncbi:hypothetical protein OJAV_G00169480 [Oryzias javanicus]|uniref:Uncharacterized protein n=1 Tax=Oryzias javanicus TaxID=123683 RepID=A0A3S2PA51_ORYJA|nr:hypothetical protein OJAV_G00169480 [Oryzias javanicus]